jgi:hypothetical protein
MQSYADDFTGMPSVCYDLEDYDKDGVVKKHDCDDYDATIGNYHEQIYREESCE